MVITVKDLVKRYGELVALDHFNLSVEKGEILGLLGPNGSGKTTALNCVLSLLTYNSGEIRVFDRPMAPDAYDIKRDIGVITQNVAVFNELTVWENTRYFCGLYITDKTKLKKLTEDAIDFVGLNDYRNFYPKKLSGGLLRRLNIACGIAHRPKLIILDEPTVAVDPQSRNNILEGIKRLNEEGATVVYTSHYMEEVEQICTRIVIMDRGRVIANGTKEELKSMISLGEKITIESGDVTDEQVGGLKTIPGVSAVSYDGHELVIRSVRDQNNLEAVLDYLRKKKINYGRIYSEMPTLNDVFLELTGTELRD